MIHIPSHMIETDNKVKRTAKDLQKQLGYEPTIEQLAEKLSMPIDKVSKALKIVKEPISFDAPIGDSEDGVTIGDSIYDSNTLSPAPSMYPIFKAGISVYTFTIFTIAFSTTTCR